MNGPSDQHAALRVALTFDAEHPDRAGHDSSAPRTILESLAAERAPATFFLQGRWVEAYPATARAVVAGGHLVGSHSFYHASMPLLSDQGLRADVERAERTIRELADADPRPWFRCPFGDGARDPRVLGVLEELGYREVGWDVSAEDWVEGSSAEEVADRVLGGIPDTGDAVVLMHTWPRATATALNPIVRGLRAAGAQLITVAELDR